MDLLDLQRLVTALIMPLPFGLGLALVGLLIGGITGVRRLGALAVVLGIGLVWVASLPVTAQHLMGGLESAYPPMAATECPRADAIVVLGGAVQPLLEGDVTPRLHRGSDRVWTAARLYRAGCAPRILVSAGGVIAPPVRAMESEAIAGFLADLGVPASSMLLEAESRNTRGNAVFSRRMLAPMGIDRVLLVTSAWHLRRAVPFFEREGFEVFPVGADYRSVSSCIGVSCWIPGAGALDAYSLAVKEYLGYVVEVIARDRCRREVSADVVTVRDWG
jgi:uncharacterized SAM-binding protein YcdF (DUF218 family)